MTVYCSGRIMNLFVLSLSHADAAAVVRVLEELTLFK